MLFFFSLLCILATGKKGLLCFLKTKWGVFIFIIFCERHRKQENLEMTYLFPHYLPDWPLRGQGFTIWPLFKSTKFTARGKSFYYPITMRRREKGGQRCLWVRDKSLHETQNITERGWMCLGVKSSGVRILSVKTLFGTSVKTIWSFNLTDSIREDTVSWNRCGLKLWFCPMLQHLIVWDNINTPFIISLESLNPACVA